MKACAKCREDIALLAMGALEPRGESELRAHVADCAECGRHLAEMEGVTRNLRAAEPESRGQPSSAFHRNVAAALRGAERPSVWAALMDWRLAWPVGCALALVIGACFVAAPRAGKPPAAAIADAPEPEPMANLAPTLSNYEWAANHSLDQLDKLLTEQGERNTAPGAVYTNFWRPSLNMAD